MKTKYRYIIIIIVVSLIALFGYFMFKKAFNDKTYDKAIVKFNGEVVATVYFKERRVEKEVEGEYPKIDLKNNFIIILGNPQEENKRYEVFIKYNFEKRSIKIDKEKRSKKYYKRKREKNKNIYSNREIKKTSGSIICLQNGVVISFENYGDDFDGYV